MTEPLERAVEELRAGRAVVLPTDTVYGVGVMPQVVGAIDRLFAAKGRPETKPIPVLGASARQLAAVAVLDERAQRLARAFWPGPLTVVVPRADGFTYDLGGNARDTVAVRVPAHDLAQALLEAAGPLAVTSANRSGEPPAMSVAEARAALGSSVAVYLDGGECFGQPSTVVALDDGMRVLRAGGIDADDLQRALR